MKDDDDSSESDLVAAEGVVILCEEDDPLSLTYTCGLLFMMTLLFFISVSAVLGVDTIEGASKLGVCGKMNYYASLGVPDELEGALLGFASDYYCYYCIYLSTI